VGATGGPGKNREGPENEAADEDADADADADEDADEDADSPRA